jgi:hypothetical protein
MKNAGFYLIDADNPQRTLFALAATRIVGGLLTPTSFLRDARQHSRQKSAGLFGRTSDELQPLVVCDITLLKRSPADDRSNLWVGP